MTQYVKTIELPPNALIINEDDRNTNGLYELESGFINIFRFEILVDGQLRVFIRHLNMNNGLYQSLSVRAWISIDPNGPELFYRFHPTTGGISHLFYDKNIVPIPEPKKHAAMRNNFSPITFVPQDELVPLEPGIYYYNVMNMVLRPNACEVAFINPVDC